MAQAFSDWKNQTEQSLIEIKQLVSKLNQNNQDQLLLKPDEKSWNAEECLQHLNSYGRYYLTELNSAIHQIKLKNIKPEKNIKGSWIGRKFTKMMTVNSQGYPASSMKSPKDHRPISNTNSSKTLEEFESQLRDLELIIQECNQINLDKVRVPISISRFIKLSAADVLDFYLAHHKRHLYQALRAVNRINHNVKIAS